MPTVPFPTGSPTNESPKTPDCRHAAHTTAYDNNDMKKTDRASILKRIAPCGLHCGKCFAFTDGDIRRHADSLRRALGNFDIYARRFETMLDEPVFAKYPEFGAFLRYLSDTSCQGCRAEKCKLFKTCNVRTCSKKHGVEFCFQCERFPCTDTGFDEHLRRRHIAINERLREIGIERYYEETKDTPRY